MIRHEGGCLCGAVRFEALGTPRLVFHCHCFSCRRQTGAAVASFAAFQVSDTFRWTKAAPAAYASSPGVTRKFCPHCGTPLSYQAEKYADEIHLNIGCFDHADDLVAEAHWHVEEKLPWFETADDLPRHRGE
jgi:hypothetical protein